MREPNSNCRDSSIFESKVGHSAFIHIQIHHIEVAQGNIFMEQIIRFGLVLGQLALMKKNWGRLGATFENNFFMFSWAKKNNFFFFKYCSVRNKKLHNISFIIFVNFLLFFQFFLMK